jgi:hypothetical protein
MGGLKNVDSWKEMEMKVFAEQLTLLDVVMFQNILPKDLIFYSQEQISKAKNIRYFEEELVKCV